MRWSINKLFKNDKRNYVRIEKSNMYGHKNINKIVRVFFLATFIILIIPHLYTLYYAMPANDDYALGQKWWGQPLLIESFLRAGWNYMNWFGQSGIIACVIQVLFSPLYWFKDAGHSYGISMGIVFVLIISGILILVRRFIKYYCKIDSAIALDTFTLLLGFIFLTVYYYSDVYNWWSGVQGYSLMILMSVLTYGNVVKYSITKTQKDYVWMIVTGVITCTSLMNCVCVGLFYVCYMFFAQRNSSVSIKKKIFPLLLYIISGVLMVIAPGNYTRMSNSTDGPHFLQALEVSIYVTIERIKETVILRPWILLFLFLILLTGIASFTVKKINVLEIIATVVVTMISVIGAFYPYSLGQNLSFETEVAKRIYFVEDYMMFIGFSVTAYLLGLLLRQVLFKDIDIKRIIVVATVMTIISGVGLVAFRERLGVFIPVDIVKKADLIRDSYYYWKDIKYEIMTSSDDDVVVTRPPITWCQYVYYMGLDDGNGDWEDSSYYGTCNQCAARLYGKKSISFIVEEN